MFALGKLFGSPDCLATYFVTPLLTCVGPVCFYFFLSAVCLRVFMDSHMDYSTRTRIAP